MQPALGVLAMAEVVSRRPTVFASLCAVGRVGACALAWLGLAGLVTGFFFAPRGIEAQPTFDDVVGFGVSAAIAGAVAAATAFAVGGKVRWARDLAMAVVVLSLLIAFSIVYAFWVDPSVARLRMDRWEFERYRNDSRLWGAQIVWFHVPLGLIVGGLLGLIAGLSARLSRNHPRGATIVPLALLFAFALEPVRISVGSGAGFLGMLLRFSGLPWSLADDAISQNATFLGALLGSLLAGVMLYVARRRQVRRQRASLAEVDAVP